MIKVFLILLPHQMDSSRKKHKKSKKSGKSSRGGRDYAEVPPTPRKKSHAHRIKWGPFEGMLAQSGSRPGQCMGIGQRVFFIEIVNPQSGSAYVQIPSSFALLTTKTVREIHPVGSAYSKYYSELQTTLKTASGTSPTAPLASTLISIDGEFVVTATDIYTFNKKMAPVVEKSAIKTLESIKLETGVDVSDSSLDSSEGPDDVAGDVAEVDLGDGPVEVVIEFDSEDEMGDFFEEKGVEPTPKTEKKTISERTTGETTIDTLQAGVLYPLLQLKEFYKRTRDSSLAPHLLDLRDQTRKFEDSLLDDLKNSINAKLDDLGTRMATKVAKFELERRGIQHKITKTKKALADAQRMSEMAISTEVKRYEDLINEAKSDLRMLYASLSNSTENIKDTLRTFLSDLDDIE